MFKIPKIEKSVFYFDQAMKAMSEYATKEREKIGERFQKTISSQRKSSDENNLNKRKDLELQKIRYLNERSNRYLRNIIKTFPKFAKVDEVYIRLINTSDVNVKTIQDALARLLWMCNTIDEMTQNTEHKIKRSKTQQTTGFLMKKYLGRINSLFRKNKEFFEKLDDARKFMNKLPTFEDIYTVAIGGFPNVGKSTLMKKITGSDVEIQNYPFTTKGLMFGYLEYKGTKAIQFIDTPGLLGRDKNNQIEQRAQLVMNDYCSKIVFVIDFTQSCGYTIEEQFKLLKRTNDLGKKVDIYLSKVDIFDEESLELKEEYSQKLKKFKVFEDSEEIKKHLITEMLSMKKKFDPSKLKLIK